MCTLHTQSHTQRESARGYWFCSFNASAIGFFFVYSEFFRSRLLNPPIYRTRGKKTRWSIFSIQHTHVYTYTHTEAQIGIKQTERQKCASSIFFPSSLSLVGDVHAHLHSHTATRKNREKISHFFFRPFARALSFPRTRCSIRQLCLSLSSCTCICLCIETFFSPHRVFGREKNSEFTQ